ncbi:Guanylyl cyclase 1 [Linum grandiflorum]
MWPLYFLSKILNVETDEDESQVIDRLVGKWQDTAVSISHFVEVPHVNQLHSWDCGLACIVMVLNTVGIGDCSIKALEDMCDTNSRTWLEDAILSSLENSDPEYVGHYIVICGYDSGSDEFEIRDPASSRKHERISSKCLEEARKSFGTDEDLLLVNCLFFNPGIITNSQPNMIRFLVYLVLVDISGEWQQTEQVFVG